MADSEDQHVQDVGISVQADDVKSTPDTVDDLGASESIISYLESSGDFNIDQEKITKWYNGIKDRVCLLIYGTGDTPEETQTFQDDCTMVKGSLNVKPDINAKEKTRSTSHVISEKLSESVFFYLIAERERQITTSLECYIDWAYPRWSDEERKAIILDMYVRFRLVRAMEDFGRDNKILFENEKWRILEVLVHRWKEAYKEDNLLKRKKWLLDYKNLAQIVFTKSPGNFVEFYGYRMRKCLPFIHRLCKDMFSSVLTFADDIFWRSMYLSGFPNNPKTFTTDPCYMKFFQQPINRMKSAIEKSYDSHLLEKMETRDIEYERDGTYKEVVTLFHEWQSKINVRDQWIWIHYSGHGKSRAMEIESFRNLNRMARLANELYTNFVLSLDCCFPNVNSTFSINNFCTILPREMNKIIPLVLGFSPFSRLLSFALSGFDYGGCFTVMKEIGWNITNCTCKTCKAYMLQLKHRDTSSGTKYECHCCTKLQDECVKVGLIFPRHVITFLKQHLCLYKYNPKLIVDLSNDEPLMLLKGLDRNRNREISTLS